MSKEKEKLLLSAQKLAQRGQLDKAIKEYLRVVEIDRKDVKVHLKLGDLYAKLRDQGGAVKHYAEAAKYYTKDGFYSKAIAVYKRVLELDENRDDIYQQMADLYQRLGMVGDAMSLFQRIAGNFEKDGKLKEALDIYRRMAELDPKNVVNLTKLAEVYYKNGMKKEGYQAFRRALNELKEQNRFEEYVRLMEKLAKADPDNSENLKELCQVYLKRKVYDRAYPVLARIHQQAPDDLQMLANLAQVCAKLERKEEAINFFKELARDYQKQGLRSSAREALEKVLALNPNDELAKKAVGGIPPEPKKSEEVVELSETAELKEEVVESGIEELEEAVEEEAVIAEEPAAKPTEEKLTPEQIQEHLTEADVYLKYGLRDKALTHIQTILKVDPENIEAFKRLKNIELEAKNQSAALESLKKICSLAEKKTDWKSLLEAARETLQIKSDDKNAEAWLKKAHNELEKLEKKRAIPEAAEPELAEEPEIIEVEEEPEVERKAEARPAPVSAKPGGKPATDMAAAKPGGKKVAEKPPAVKAPPKEAEAVFDFKEDLEEAEFYTQQGLEDEALRVYLEILKKDPKNQQALARSKELEAAIKSKAGKAEEEEIEVEVSAQPAEAEVKAEAEEEVLVEEEEAEEGEVLEEEEVAERAEEKVAESIDTGIDFGVKAGEEARAGLKEQKEEGEREEVIEEEVVLSVEGEAEKVELGAKAEEEALAEEPAESAEEEEPRVSWEEGPGADAMSAEAGSAESADIFAGAGAEGAFDLAAELEKDDSGPAPQVTGLSTSEKYSFNDMFKSFKEGVSKQVSEDDAATHYDLGIAYKEMGLYDDSEQEFRVALKAGHNVTDCHLMIGLCYAERGRYEKAIEEYESGISVPSITDKEKTALFYELAQAWMGLGDLNKALKMFEKTQSLDPGFREVGARVEEVKSRLGGARPKIPEVPSREEVSWESAALSEPGSSEEEKAEEGKREEEKKKRSKKISYV